MPRIRVQVPGGGIKSIVVAGSLSGGSDPPATPGNQNPLTDAQQAAVLSLIAQNTTPGISSQVQQTSGIVNASSSAAGANTQIQYNSSGALGASANLTFDGNGIVVGTNAGMYSVNQLLGSTFYGSVACTGTGNGYFGWTIDDGWQYPSFMSQGSTSLGIYMKTLGSWLILYQSAGIQIGSGGQAITTGIWNATTIAVGHGGTGITGTPTAGQILVGNGSNYTLTSIATGTNSGSGLSIANASGSITIANTGIGTSYAAQSTGKSLTTSNVALGTIAMVAGTYLVEIYMYLSASTSSTLTISGSVSAGTLTAQTGGEVRIHNASNTVNNDLVNTMASGALSIFSSTTQTWYGWGIITLSANATLTINALCSATATTGQTAITATRIA